MNILHYIQICDSIILLMQPLIEVIIHDLVSGKIYYINGNLSKRKVGDLSLLEPGEFEKNIDQIVYPKINFDGRLIKSVSVPVDNKWLICINADASVWSFSYLKPSSSINAKFMLTLARSDSGTCFISRFGKSFSNETKSFSFQTAETSSTKTRHFLFCSPRKSRAEATTSGLAYIRGSNVLLKIRTVDWARASMQSIITDA